MTRLTAERDQLQLKLQEEQKLKAELDSKYRSLAERVKMVSAQRDEVYSRML